MQFSLREIKELDTNQKIEIVSLWNTEYPESLNHKSLDAFDAYLEKLQDKSHRLFVNKDDMIAAWYTDFIRNEERFFAILVHSEFKAKGLGSTLLSIAKQKRKQLNGWVIDHDKALLKNGMNYQSPMAFYIKNGFVVLTDCRLELPAISAVKIQWNKQ